MKNTTAMADYELRHIEALRKNLAGCTVLLKKDGSFPLEKPCTLAAYGSGVRRTIRGGTGSGEVNSRYSVTIEEGLQQAGFTLTGMEWHTGYEQAREKAHKAFLKQLKKDAKAAKQNFILYGMGKVMPEPEYDLPLDAEGTALEELLGAARPGVLALGGRVSAAAKTLARQAGVELVDYFLRPELACLNAVPTAEGCLALLMQLRQRTIWESEFLVLGYGRIGRAVARRLQALGGLVTIAARAPEQRAAARCAGLHAAPLTALEQLLPHFDAVINTIPAPVLGAAQLRCLPRGALILDLASRPGGTDFAAARELGLRAEHALSLPARCAPETAGALVAHTVEVILQERAATARSERGVS